MASIRRGLRGDRNSIQLSDPGVPPDVLQNRAAVRVDALRVPVSVAVSVLGGRSGGKPFLLAAPGHGKGCQCARDREGD